MFAQSRTIALRLGLGLLTATLLIAAYSRTQTIPMMTDVAKEFLNSLWPEQRGKATFTLADDERFNWFYTPVPRKGLPLREMTSSQRQLAMALVSAGLSQRGFIKTATIMSLEDVLAGYEGRLPTPNRRDSDGYFISIFGEPSATGVWAYRVEGHHLSLHFMIVNGKLSGAPTFMGSNPAEVLEGRRKGLRALEREEDLGRDLVQSLTAEQQKTAIVDAKAPADILTEHSREAALKGQANGIQVSALNAAQREKLRMLIDEYCNNLVPELADYRREQARKAGNNLWFAWAGGINRGDLNYYRIQSPEFLVEFDETQDKGNHIHSVWRDFAGDFGRDLLKDHYKSAHGQ